jgi:hypothetical protein
VYHRADPKLPYRAAPPTNEPLCKGRKIKPGAVC